MAKEYITHKGKKYYFEVLEKNIKNINLKVDVNKNVKISVPSGTEMEYIKSFVKEKSDWIQKQFDYYDSYAEEKENIKFEDGETVYLLGKQYKMKVSKSEKNNIYVDNKYLKIDVTEKYIKNKDMLQREYDKWLKKYAKKILTDITEEYHKPLKKYKIDLPEIEIRKMKNRWGSCLHTSNKIIYNLNLIKAPICCAEYVALHELSHLKYKNHDEKFYNFMTIFMPDWQERKKLLDEEFGGIV